MRLGKGRGNGLGRKKNSNTMQLKREKGGGRETQKHKLKKQDGRRGLSPGLGSRSPRTPVYIYRRGIQIAAGKERKKEAANKEDWKKKLVPEKRGSHSLLLY